MVFDIKKRKKIKKQKNEFLRGLDGQSFTDILCQECREIEQFSC